MKYFYRHQLVMLYYFYDLINSIFSPETNVFLVRDLETRIAVTDSKYLNLKLTGIVRIEVSLE